MHNFKIIQHWGLTVTVSITKQESRAATTLASKHIPVASPISCHIHSVPAKSNTKYSISAHYSWLNDQYFLLINASTLLYMNWRSLLFLYWTVYITYMQPSLLSTHYWIILQTKQLASMYIYANTWTLTCARIHTEICTVYLRHCSRCSAVYAPLPLNVPTVVCCSCSLLGSCIAALVRFLSVHCFIANPAMRTCIPTKLVTL